MTKHTQKNSVVISLLLIGFIAIFQPYIVLGFEYGPSNKCLDCLMIEQTFFTSFFYLFIPMSALYLLSKRFSFHPLLQAFLVLGYYVPVSFVKLTIPLFDDRIAAWSTFSEKEIWNTAMFMATPIYLILSGIFIFLMNKVNKVTSIN